MRAREKAAHQARSSGSYKWVRLNVGRQVKAIARCFEKNIPETQPLMHIKGKQVVVKP